MFYHDPHLQYEVRVDTPNPLFAKMLQQAIGGIEGEFSVIERMEPLGRIPELAEPPPYTFNAPTPADVAMGPMKKAVETHKDVLS